MGYFGQFLADSMSGGQARSLLLGSGDEQRVQWSFDHWAIFAPFSNLCHSLFIKWHRSHSETQIIQQGLQSSKQFQIHL